jgi:hypothetical protein
MRFSRRFLPERALLPGHGSQHRRAARDTQTESAMGETQPPEGDFREVGAIQADARMGG